MANPIDLCTLNDVRPWLDMAPSPIRRTGVLTGGSGYTSATASVVPTDGNGSGAVLTPVLSGGAVVGLTITNAGKDYTAAPAVIISGNGSGATAEAFISDDVLLAKLITNASVMFNTECNRPLGFKQQMITEKRNGNGAARMVLYNWPITAVSSLYINNLLIPSSPDAVKTGFLFDQTGLYLIGQIFPEGFQNVTITYTFGYSTVPEDVQQAVMELVAQKYRRRAHVDQESQNLNGQSVGFAKTDIPREVRTVIDNYSLKVMIE